MPTYAFRCPNGHEFDKLFKMSEAPADLPCPTCGEPAVRQLSGGAGLVFKGSGFYLTDYGKNAHRGGSGGSSSASSGGESKPSESKGGDKGSAGGSGSSSGGSTGGAA